MRKWSSRYAALRKVLREERSGGPRSPVMEILECGHKQRKLIPFDNRHNQTIWRRCDPCGIAEDKKHSHEEA